MRWQKIARLAIALFVIGFAIVVFLAMRPRPSARATPTTWPAPIPKAILESGAGERKQFKFGKLDFTVKYERLLNYKDGRSKMGGVTLTLPDRNGRDDGRDRATRASFSHPRTSLSSPRVVSSPATSSSRPTTASRSSRRKPPTTARPAS